MRHVSGRVAEGLAFEIRFGSEFAVRIARSRGPLIGMLRLYRRARAEIFAVKYRAYLRLSGSIPLCLIAGAAPCDARKAISLFADSTSFAPATTAAENTEAS
jgi:hypothetical protein